MREKKRSLGGFIIKSIFFLCVIALIGAALFGVYAAAQWGTYDREKLENYAQSTFIYDSEGAEIENLHGGENRINADISALPEHVKNAFIAAEDVRFYKHFGVDPIRMAGALVSNLKSGSLSEGASTITQQLIKLTHLTPEKLWSRKLNEAYYAVLVERDYTKDEILEMYMNYVYFGNGAYGVQAAAMKYFGVDAEDLTITQAASLAATLKAPSNYAPHINPENNKRRRDMVLNIMLEEKMITKKEAETAINSPIELAENAINGNKFGWFVDASIENAIELLGINSQELMSGGYRIMTTLDPDAYAACEIAAENLVGSIPSAQNGAKAQCAIVLLDKDGAVRAMIGGSEYLAARGLNRATAKRQPGSAIKPIAVYSPAIELMGLQTTSFLDDSPTDFGGYSPSNYGGTYNGYITARTAFEKSLNIPAVSLVNTMGVNASVNYLAKFGIETEAGDRYLPLALGSMTYGVSPLDLCAGYLAFINDGNRPDAYIISEIISSDGKTVYRHQTSMTASVSPATAYIIADLMRTTAINGTGRRLNALPYPVGSKTGTVGFGDLGNRDAWSVAITPGHAVAVWTGFDSTTSEMYLPSYVTGSSLPTQAVLEILSSYLPGGDGDFIQPASVVRLDIDAKTLSETGIAYLATDITPKDFIINEVFPSGNRPYEYSEYWRIPALPADLAVANGEGYRPIISFTSTSNHARYRLFRTTGNETEEIAIWEGAAGQQISFTDENAKWLTLNNYFVTAEHSIAVDYGMKNAIIEPSAAIGFRPFFFPFGWNLDF